MSYLTRSEKPAIPLLPVQAGQFDAWKEAANERHRHWLESAGFEAKSGRYCALPGEDGKVESYLFVMRKEGWLYQFGFIVRQPA